MVRPLSSWNKTQAPSHPNLVWRAKVDNRFLIEIHRVSLNSPTIGKLYLFDHEKNDKEILCWDITIPDDAKYGSAIWDTKKWNREIQTWEMGIIDFIENTYLGDER